MFGQPAWFVRKKKGWGVTPVTWQGWVHTGAWLSAISLPFLFLVSQALLPEALIWLAVSAGAYAWDVRKILRSMSRQTPTESAAEEVFYIGDDTDGKLATRNYNFMM